MTGEKASNNTLGLLQLTTPLSGDQKFTSSFTADDFMTPTTTMASFLADLASGNLYVSV
jgi:hypothetical protein